MFERIRKLLAQNGISLCAPIALVDCKITRGYLLERAGIGESGTAVMFAIPYHTPVCEAEHRNLSRYAVGRDYHLFLKELSDGILPILKQEYPSAKFALFSDHSPIDEREAAAKTGLGMIGEHGLLITDRYSSYVFIGELITDTPLPDKERHIVDVATCEKCGACLAVCPYMRGEIDQCLSALTQKKGQLTEEEANVLLKYDTVWGCDLCQQVCPHTRSALISADITTPIRFFHEVPLPYLTYRDIANMPDAELASRAYAWRGRDVILRNLAIWERKHGDKEKPAEADH